MKRFFKHPFYRCIVILFAVLLLGLLIGEILHPSHIIISKADRHTLYHQVWDAFHERVPKDSYSYYLLDYYSDETTRLLFINRWKVKLEIGVVDEAVIDKFLASWNGEQWDKLVKVPSDCSRALQEEFVEKAESLDWDPKIEFHIGIEDMRNDFGWVFSSHADREWPILYCWVTLAEGTPEEEAANWQELPQAVKELAIEMGIPLDHIYYSAPLSPRPWE